MADALWRLKITHDCDSRDLRAAAIERMRALVQQGAGKAQVTHTPPPPADIVRVSWAGNAFIVVVHFSPGLTLVGVRVPALATLFSSAIEKRVRTEIAGVIANAGGGGFKIERVADR